MCDCEGLRDNMRADIIQLWRKKMKKNTSWESKSIHCAMKPIRIQLDSPYNSSNETKNTHVWVFYVVIIHCTSNVLFLYIITCARGAASTNVLLVYSTVHSNTVFHSVNESVFEWIEWASDSTVPFRMVSLVRFLLITVMNESFGMNDSVSHLLNRDLLPPTGGLIVIFIYPWQT